MAAFFVSSTFATTFAVASFAAVLVSSTFAAKKRKPRTKTAKKAAKEELKPEVYIQYQGREGVVEDAIKKVTEQFVAEGHRASTIKSLQLYLKPEENAAYYVINQKIAGRVDLF